MKTESKSGKDMPESLGESDQQARKQVALTCLNGHAFNPPWWLRNAHLQTVGARYLRTVPKPSLRVERWDTPDDDFLDIHFYDGDPAMPTAVLLHGLEGSIDSTYFIGLIHELAQANWNVAAMEFRSCSGEMNRAARMYHSGETGDVAYVVQRLIERDPDIRIYVAGYSLGGNVTAKWFGEQGDALPVNVCAGAAISAPYDLVASGKHMDSTFSRLYVRHFLRYLKPKAVEKDQQHPGILDLDKILAARTFQEFDDHATAPLHGFKDAHDYYTRVGCGRFLSGVRRPLLLLSADDDPFNPGHTQPRDLAEEHPYLHAQFTRRGGHVGFVQCGPTEGFSYWAEEQIVRFFDNYREMDS